MRSRPILKSLSVDEAVLSVDYLRSPLGWLTLSADREGLRGLCFANQKGKVLSGEGRETVAKAIAQLEEYFCGARRAFSLPLAPCGTAFQRAVWQALLAIPFGQTLSYRDLARRIGRPLACRAVGNANGKNPIPIIIPCHRVIAADGGLGGYSSGLDRKRDLLRHEGA